LLRTYPNRRFVDTITSIALHGTRVGFEGNPSGQVQRPNHASAFSHPEIITQSIQNELQKGRVKRILSLPDDFFCSPQCLSVDCRLREKLETKGYEGVVKSSVDLARIFGGFSHDAISPDSASTTAKDVNGQTIPVPFRRPLAQ